MCGLYGGHGGRGAGRGCNLLQVRTPSLCCCGGGPGWRFIPGWIACRFAGAFRPMFGRLSPSILPMVGRLSPSMLLCVTDANSQHQPLVSKHARVETPHRPRHDLRAMSAIKSSGIHPAGLRRLSMHYSDVGPALIGEYGEHQAVRCRIPGRCLHGAFSGVLAHFPE